MVIALAVAPVFLRAVGVLDGGESAVAMQLAIAVVLVACLVYYEHSLVKPDDLSKLNFAFFNLNGYISSGLSLLTIGDVLLWK